MDLNAIKEKVSGKQASNNIQRQASRQNVTLGIDIGTQFCFAGYVKNGAFFSMNGDNINFKKYGIPTAIAFRKEADGTYSYLCGQAAIDKAGNGEYYLISQSLKTQLRKKERFQVTAGMTDFTFDFEDTKNQLKEFLISLLLSIDYNQLSEMKIDKIVVAYPNVSDDGNSYTNILKETLSGVICGLEEDKRSYYAKNVDIETVCEGKLASVAMAEHLGLRNDEDIMTVDVGGGTIDLALISGGTKKLLRSKSYDNGIKREVEGEYSNIVPSNQPYISGDFKSKCFSNEEITDSIVACIPGCYNECYNCWNCEKREIKEMRTSLKNTYKKIFEYVLKVLLIQHGCHHLNICLLGGGSNMIFIQEALKQAFSDLGYNNIRYWTITPTNGNGYEVVYNQKDKSVNEKNITTANFLAYAAALFGELQRTAEKSRRAENNQNPESGTGTEFTGEAADLRIVWEVPSLSYAIQYNDNGKAKYVMFPKNSFASDGNIYMIAPGIFSAKEPNDTGTQVDLSKNIVFIKQDRSNIEIKEIQMIAGIMEVAEKIKCDGGERSISADDVNKANTIGPKEIAHKDFTEGEFACVICIKYCGGVFVSYDKKLQIYLYRSPWHDQEQRFVLPNDGEKPYFAEGELTEERKRQLGDAYYDFELKFKDFMERSGQNLKC